MSDDLRLSPAGERRRDAILAAALRAAGRRRTRRRATRVAVATLAVALAAFAFRRPTSPAVPPAPPLAIVPPPATTPVASILVERIVDDASIRDRHRFDPRPGGVSIERIDDAELIRSLADAGRQPALASIGGRHVLTLDGALIGRP